MAAQPFDDFKYMGGEKNRGAPCNHALEHSLQSARGDGIHGFEWLVEEENLRPVDHRCGQRELFLHSVRVVGNEFLRLVRQLHELEQFSCPLRCRLAVKAVHAADEVQIFRAG